MDDQHVNETRLQILEGWALDGEKAKFSGGLNQQIHEDRLAYLKAIKHDFDRLHALDPQFPELIIYGHDIACPGQPVNRRIFPHALDDIDVSDARLEIDRIFTRKAVTGADRLFNVKYWDNPQIKTDLYDSDIHSLKQALTEMRARQSGF